MEELEIMTLTAEDGEQLCLHPLAENRLAGRKYMAAEEVDPEDPDFQGEIFLLRAAECAEDEAYEEYEIVTDENEMNAVLVLMQDDLEELGITIEE